MSQRLHKVQPPGEIGFVAPVSRCLQHCFWTSREDRVTALRTAASVDTTNLLSTMNGARTIRVRCEHYVRHAEPVHHIGHQPILTCLATRRKSTGAVALGSAHGSPLDFDSQCGDKTDTLPTHCCYAVARHRCFS